MSMEERLWGDYTEEFKLWNVHLQVGKNNQHLQTGDLRNILSTPRSLDVN